MLNKTSEKQQDSTSVPCRTRLDNWIEDIVAPVLS